MLLPVAGKKGEVSDGRKNGRGGHTANELCVVIKKYSGEKERQKRDEHEKNGEFDPTQPKR
jgi:hypothetical protein